jgi:beta-glucosidase
LKPGETGTARLTIGLRDLSYYDTEAKAFRADAGSYELVVAANAADIRACLPLTLAEDWSEPVKSGRK